MTQQTLDDLTALIQITDQLTGQLNAEMGPQSAGPLLAQLQQCLRASTANCSRAASRSRSISSGMDVVMTETELDQLALQCEAATANERETIVRDFLTKRRKRGTEGPMA